MQKIIPHLWFDKTAGLAAKFYETVFPNSCVKNISVIKDTPGGDTEIVNFEIFGYQMMAISAGPYFKINPSVSFMLNFDPEVDKNAKKTLDKIWNKLIDGGTALMPLDKYPFSEHYGWVQDKFGVSWQLMLTGTDSEKRPEIIPSLLFVNNSYAKAQKASDYYISIFKNCKRGVMNRYPSGMEPDREGTVMYTDFQLENQWFIAMDSGHKHDFNFTEAVSFIINCKDQSEVDYFWSKLSSVPESEQCGWVKDKFGLSWQIVPTALNDLMSKGNSKQKEAVTKTFLNMKKLIISDLEKAFYNAK